MDHRLRQKMVWGIRASFLVASLISFGCSGDDLSDPSTGFIDLVPYFKTGATTADPTAGLPRNIAPTRGWVNGSRVEYADFGAVGVPRKFDAKGTALKVPDVATVFPMYFFFDANGLPLFSKPAFDSRSGVWYMRGGANPPNPTPISTPTDDGPRAAYFTSPYLLRPRDTIYDTDRGSSTFQRPIIDTLYEDANYSGLWEIVEITVKQGGYQPDAIKSAATVKAGIASGKLAQNRTGKVINCPVLDDRTQVTPTVMANNIPRPRMEVWYRTKLGSCYLINGWETIGQTVDEGKAATDQANLRLYRAAIDQNNRLDTFDVIRYTAGNAADQKLSVAVPVVKLYTPTIAVPIANGTMDKVRTRYSGDDLSIALPRHKDSDPPGYSPIVWLWDLGVPQDPPYQAGTFKDIGSVDPTAVAARDGDTTVLTRNYPIIGQAMKCVSDADCKLGLQCNPMPDANIATTDAPPGKNIADMVIAREGGPRCDVPVAGFGGYCSPGVSRCDIQAAAGGENEKRLKALGVSVAGPTFTVHADLKTAQGTLSDTTMLAGGVDPKMPTRMVTAAEQTTAMAALPALQATVDQLAARVAQYDRLGFTSDYGGYGYSCFPAAGGYCQIRCDAMASSTAVPVATKVPVPDGLIAGQVNQMDYTFNTEARCGGTNMLGYKCLPATVQPDRQRVCLRECNAMAPLNVSQAVCAFSLNLKTDANNNSSTAFSLSQDLAPKTALAGESCAVSSTVVSGVSATITGCSWDPSFEPRDPGVWPGP